jgi:serine/threonine protein phosphatase PrpC
MELLARSKSHLRFAMRTDVGCVRPHNEDSCAADSAMGAFVVCDGIGGAAAGEIASRLDYLRSRLASMPAAECSSSAQRLCEAIHTANAAVLTAGRRARHLRGMGTTVVALLFGSAADGHGHGELALAHVGDSRCYRLRDGRMELLTSDHSFVAEQVRAGHMTEAEAERSPMRSFITRAIGTTPAVEPEVQRVHCRAGDLYLLASDGLTGELADPEIAAAMATIATLPEPTAAMLDAVCAGLVASANARGGHDNVTVLLVRVG